MKLVNSDVYKTAIFYFEDEHGNDYKVTYNETHDDILITEWLVQDDENEEIDETNSIYETLITLSKNKLYEYEN